MIAFSQTVYDWMKTFHILGAIAWVGGGLFTQIYSARLLAAGETGRAAVFAKDIEKLGLVLFMPASVIVLLMGIAMTLYAPFIEVTDAWILFGLAGIVSTILFGSLFLGPEAGRIGRAVEERGVEDPEVGRRIARLTLVARIDLAIIVLVVIAMVLKPGD